MIYTRPFYAFNALFWIMGWGSLGLGLWLYTQNRMYSILVPPSYSAMSSAGLCISVGSMIIIISFIGCIGNWSGSKNLLLSFFAFVFLLLFIQCVTGIIGFFYKNKVQEHAKITLYASINKTHGLDPISKNLMITWDELQTNLKCCGVENYTNWFYTPQWNRKRFVPDSCCDISYFNPEKMDSLKNCGKVPENFLTGRIYKEGCHVPFTNWLLLHLYIVGVLSIIFVSIEALLLIISLQLIKHFKKIEKKYSQECRCKYNRNENDSDNYEGECKLISRTNSI